MKVAATLLSLALAALGPTHLVAAEDPPPPGASHETEDNGTDPTRVSRTAMIKLEHLDLRDGFSSNSLRLWYTQPLGPGFSAVFKLPVTQVDVLGNDGVGLGDVSIQLGKVFGLTRAGGHVVQAEMIFETATRPELGGNQNVLKATYVRAFFLKKGILAPSFLHNVGLWGQGDRPRVNLTTVDLYFVPKMGNPRNLVTFDPNFSYNWDNEDFFASLAVTLGRNLGKAFGGNQFLLLKPAIVAGGDRPNNWGVELTYKVIGF
jgi:hypothetical protein